MKTVWRLPALAVLSMTALCAQDYPSARITNGLITVDLYLPDAQHGSYRATRFDWSGIIHSLTYKGHNFFGQWYEKHDPYIHDAITGPVNIFDNQGPATGYAEAKPGETFVRIGVGRVEKPEEPNYRETNTYKVADSGDWKIERTANSIRFVQELPDRDGRTGYGYVYTKEILLVPGKPEMMLTQNLRNTGTKVLDSSVFNHGFFQIDKEPAGPELVWTFPFEPHTTGDFGGYAALRGHQVVYLKELKPGERTMAQLTGFTASPDDHSFTVENRKTGAGVRVKGDHPITRLTFWSRRGAYSPEASIHLHIPPGQSERWKNTYEFYVKGPR